LCLAGGSGQQIGPYILPHLREVVARFALEQPLRAASVVQGQLGPHAVAMGAATLALDVFLTEAGDARKWRSRHATAGVTE
jgi:hypothetical protein